MNKQKWQLALDDISQYRNEIYGLSILWIMLFHAIAMLGLNYTFGYDFLKPLNKVIQCGNMGVEIFLICSGIFLYYSYTKNSDLLTFMKKRISRLFWPVLVLSLGYWIWACLIQSGNLLSFIRKVCLLEFWMTGDQQIWFVSFILICYILYPFIYAFLFQSKFANKWVRFAILMVITLLLTLALQQGNPQLYKKWEIGITRFPAFFIGCFAGKFVCEKKTMPWWNYGVFLAMLTGGIYLSTTNLLSGAWNRWSYLLIGIPVMFFLIAFLNIVKWKWLRTFLSFFGKISLNLYISHVLVTRIYKTMPFYENKRLLHYLVILLISILLAWLAELVITAIQRKVKS